MAVFPANTFPTPNRIALKCRGRYDEGVVSSAQVFPGYLVMDDGAGGIKPHNVYGERAEMAIALEQGLQGIGGATTPIGAFDAYAVGVQAQFLRPAKGDELQVLVRNGDNATEGSFLVSNGDGTFAVVSSLAVTGGNLYETTDASTAITNTTTETKFSQSYVIPAKFLQAGDILHVRAQGIAPATNSTDTLTIKLYIGGLTGTLIVSTGALDVANNDEFLIDAYIEFRTVGASGTFIANGTDTIGTPGTATVKSFLVGSTSIDTTVTQEIALSATWSVANAGDSCRLDLLTVDLVRQAGSIVPLAVVATAVDNTGGTTGQSYSPSALVPCRAL